MNHYRFEDDFDAAAVTELRPVLEELAKSGEDVTIDMELVNFLDSSGVGAIVFLYKRLRVRGLRLRLQSVTGQPLSLLSHLRMMDLVDTKAKGAAA
jgi:anti-anti-sigma factor